jgi:phosphate transport system protein
MLKGIVNASVYKDLKLAIRVWKMDDLVDQLHNQGHEELIALASKEKEERRIRVLLEEAFLIRHLERVADHITNIAEELYYIETGKQLKDSILGGEDRHEQT